MNPTHAEWHPLQSSVLHDKFMYEFTVSLLDYKPPFERLIEGLFENAPKLFWPCCRHFRETKDSVLDREDYQLQYYVCKKQYFWTHRGGIPPGNNTLNFEYDFVLRIYVFESRELENGACLSDYKSRFELNIIIYINLKSFISTPKFPVLTDITRQPELPFTV
jgi:hypothetical protein